MGLGHACRGFAEGAAQIAVQTPDLGHSQGAPIQSTPQTREQAGLERDRFKRQELRHATRAIRMVPSKARQAHVDPIGRGTGEQARHDQALVSFQFFAQSVWVHSLPVS
jgi:hypothetical protein